MTGVEGYSLVESLMHFHLYSQFGWYLLSATRGKASFVVITGLVQLVKQNGDEPVMHTNKIYCSHKDNAPDKHGEILPVLSGCRIDICLWGSVLMILKDNNKCY